MSFVPKRTSQVHHIALKLAEMCRHKQSSDLKGPRSRRPQVQYPTTRGGIESGSSAIEPEDAHTRDGEEVSVSVILPAQGVLPISILFMIDCAGGRVPQDFAWEGVNEYAPDPSAAVRVCQPEELKESVIMELNKMILDGCVRQADLGDWVLTDKGRQQLDSWGLA